MRFIDLFAGLGGFHKALSDLGHNCVFASEIDEELQQIYKLNFKTEIQGDIRKIKEKDIPAHDILCAGFPCQPFSKAGIQEGLDDLDRGNLFYDISRILKYHKPSYFILENVPNIISHDGGRTWGIILNILEDKLGYNCDYKKLSPHQFGIPQIRERVFIVGSKKGLKDFEWPLVSKDFEPDISSILESGANAKKVPEREMECLLLWQKFLDLIPESSKLPSFPIWSMEFGASYPFEGVIPFNCSSKLLNNCLGQFGESLYGMSHQNQLERIPKYARNKEKQNRFPKWKQNFIRQNREFYQKNKSFIEPLIPYFMKLPPSWQKFEWNCQGEEREIFNLIIQFRASGIRVKRRNFSPSLVSSTTTQIPIVGWEKRYITAIEGARLQSLEGLILPENGKAFKALGNAVNATIAKLIAKNLIGKTLKKANTGLKHHSPQLV